MIGIDVLENELLAAHAELIPILLKDQTTSTPDQPKNIIWATADYAHLDAEYQPTSPILPHQITGSNGSLIQPRVAKAKAVQADRTRNMAEVFTPSWICNTQNNLIDEAWFGRKNVFNTEFVDENGKHQWRTNTEKIAFPEGKTWQDYVNDTRLEITCGEAPYLVSRYDTTTGNLLPIADRIGILDRKLRVVNENCSPLCPDEWLQWVQNAFKSTYGYEFQGDNLLIARENMLATFMDYYQERHQCQPTAELLLAIAHIISWNLWQMDGLKGVVPFSCYDKVSKYQPADQLELLCEEPTNITPKIIKCTGCTKKKNKMMYHNGSYCLIRDWSIAEEEKQKIRFVDIMS